MNNLRNILLCVLLMSALAGAADDPSRKLVTRADPDYPELARKNNLHGTVKLKLWINPDGTVRRVEYIGGHPVLAESAIACAKVWKYQPATAESTATVELKF